MVAQIASVGRLSRKEVFEKLRKNKRITRDDYEFLRIATGDDILYSPYSQRFEDVKRGDVTYEAGVVLGCASALPQIREVLLVDGRWFTDNEERTRAQVAIIGDDIRTRLFPGESPLGKTIKVRGLDFTVLGVQERLGSSFGRTQDNSIYIPISVFWRMYGAARSLTIFGRPKPDTGMNLEGGMDVTRAALRARFHTQPGKDDNFEFLTPDSIRGFIDNIIGLISVVVVPVTMISLVVGGIVIMNIMLVSVTERTREIGVRKSLGAKSADILLQFLVESVLVSAVGGLIGLAFAALVCVGLERALDARLAITARYVLLALFVSATVGILSGWYPARRAARMDPIAALRQE
jgi:putative ABC transport system permease protein